MRNVVIDAENRMAMLCKYTFCTVAAVPTNRPLLTVTFRPSQSSGLKLESGTDTSLGSDRLRFLYDMKCFIDICTD